MKKHGIPEHMRIKNIGILPKPNLVLFAQLDIPGIGTLLQHSPHQI
jgi:hypothetical protein